MFDSERQELVGQRVPEVEHAVRLADEPRAEDDVGLALDDRLDQLRDTAPGRTRGRRPGR